MITEYIGGNLSMSKPILEANAVVPLYRQLMEKLQKEITSRNIEARR